jgi:hypothetical protein
MHPTSFMQVHVLAYVYALINPNPTATAEKAVHLIALVLAMGGCHILYA